MARIAPIDPNPTRLGGLACRVFEDAEAVDVRAWRALCPPDDWGMDMQALRVQQRALAGQARFWYVLVEGVGGRTVASAALALFHVDIVQKDGTLRRLAERVRRVWPGFLKMRVLFCGLPVPCGGHHLRIAPGVDRSAVLGCLDRQLTTMAAAHGARLIVFKEFPDAEASAMDGLDERGFVRGDVPPNYRIRRQFAGLGEYGSALRSGYRRAMAASLRKFAALDLTVSHVTDPAEIAARFDTRLHRLYLNVWRRSPNRLECFPESFFRELPLALPGKVVLSVIERAGEPVAFGYGVMAGAAYHSLYIGYEPRLNEVGNLYFNITLQCMDCAFASGAGELVLGQTADEFKTRLGAIAEPLSFLARAPNPLVHMALKAFAGQIFPAVALPSPHHVFADAPGRLPPQQTV